MDNDGDVVNAVAILLEIIVRPVSTMWVVRGIANRKARP